MLADVRSNTILFCSFGFLMKKVHYNNNSNNSLIVIVLIPCEKGELTELHINMYLNIYRNNHILTNKHNIIYQVC